MKETGKLLFGTAGSPVAAKSGDTISGLKLLKELGLDAMELEYVYGAFPGEEKARAVALAAEENGIRLTAHGPYYINLNSNEEKKFEDSRNRILKTARMGSLSGAESITFHAAFYQKSDPEKVFMKVHDVLDDIVRTLRESKVDVDVRPETTGKSSQFGTLDEIVRLSAEVEGIHPCIDWSHLHARTGEYNTSPEFQSVIDSVRRGLGDRELRIFHMHISGIQYGPSGEKKHLDMKESDFNYKDLLHVLKDNGITGIMIAESPHREDDALLLKDYYEKI
ncbi:MAG: TIM barrel protein [Candidatus Latescibacter sp.]|nr:TIM barrel protein [Candidatus Latescibacter sp.]